MGQIWRLGLRAELELEHSTRGLIHMDVAWTGYSHTFDRRLSFLPYDESNRVQ